MKKSHYPTMFPTSDFIVSVPYRFRIVSVSIPYRFRIILLSFSYLSPIVLLSFSYRETENDTRRNERHANEVRRNKGSR